MQKRSVLVFGMAMIAVALIPLVADAQDQDRRGGGRRGFGRGGPGGGGADMLVLLLRNEKVQKELEVLEDQVKQAEEAVEKVREEGRSDRGERPDFRNLSEEERRKLFQEFSERRREQDKKLRAKLAEILLPPQLERLEQIVIQIQGVGALQDPEVVAKLKITPEQQEKIDSVQDQQREAMRERMQALFQGGRENIDREKMREEFTKMQQELEGKILAVLTAQQKKDFDALKGPAFEISREDLFQGRGGEGRGQFRRGQNRRDGQNGDRPRRPQ